jgi:hypothetical protein
MINKIRNDKNSSIKLKKQLMNITNNINSVRKRNNKSPDIRIKENKYMSEELSTYKYLDSSNIRKCKNINNINMYINNNKIYKRNHNNDTKYNSFSLIDFKKSDLNKIHKNNIFNRNSINKNNYDNKIKSRTNIPKKYSINENFKEQFSDNTNFRKYNNISLNQKNLENKIERENMLFENFDNDFERIYKRKINNKIRNASNKYIKYKNEEIKNNNDGISNEKKIIFRNYSTRKNKFFNTFNHSKIYKRKDEYDITDILNLLKAKNINDSIAKINKLLVYKNFIHQLKDIYLENNNQKKHEQIKIRDILFFFSPERKSSNKYEELCKAIMRENNIYNFEDFKLFLKKLIIGKISNNNFVKGINKIFDGFNKVQPNRTIYRNLSQKNMRNNFNIKNDDDIDINSI